MKKPYPLLCILFLIYWSCEDTKEEESTIIFSKIFGGSGWDQLSFIQQTTDDGYIIIGTTESFGNGGFDTWLIKIYSKGNKLWDQTFGDELDEIGKSIYEISDGFIILVKYRFLMAILNLTLNTVTELFG